MKHTYTLVKPFRIKLTPSPSTVATLRYSIDLLSKDSLSTFKPSYNIATMQTPIQAPIISETTIWENNNLSPEYNYLIC